VRLVGDRLGFERVGRLAPVGMPGGAGAIKAPWRMAAACLDAAYGDGLPGGLPIRSRHEGRWNTVVGLARSGLSSPATSSAGRLFDAVAAVLGVRDAVNYEGQAAVELEQRANPAESGAYPLAIQKGGGETGG